jgi:hypothetical protein
MNEKREEIPNKKTEGRKRTRGDGKREEIPKKNSETKKKNPEKKPGKQSNESLNVEKEGKQCKEARFSSLRKKPKDQKEKKFLRKILKRKKKIRRENPENKVMKV